MGELPVYNGGYTGSLGEAKNPGGKPCLAAAKLALPNPKALEAPRAGRLGSHPAYMGWGAGWGTQQQQVKRKKYFLR